MSIMQTVGAFFDERLARRKAYRERLAKNELIDRRCDEIRAAIADINTKLDRETEKHEAATAPIQSGLADIERAELDAMVSQRPVDESLAARRQELLERLEAANMGLETAADVHRKRLGILNRELAELAKGRDKEAFPLYLASPAVANPDLLDANFVSQKRIQWAQARLEAAQSRVDVCEDALAKHLGPRQAEAATTANIQFDGTVRRSRIDSAETARIEMHRRRARLELTAALAERSAAMEEAAKIHAAILAE